MKYSDIKTGDGFMNCIDCAETDLVFEGENEYEPDPETGEPRCFSCDLKANPERYEETE